MFLHTHLLEARSTILFQSNRVYHSWKIDFLLKFVLSRRVKYFINIVRYDIDRYIFAIIGKNGI